MGENKVRFGLKNVHYAPLESDVGSTATFGTPVPWPGAVSLAMSPEGEFSEFYADDGAYYVTAGNNGYKGDLEMARVPDSFRKDILNEIEDVEAGTMTENISAEPKPFALLFEFAGDVRATKHVLYNCAAGRPNVEGKTNGKTKEPTTEKLTIKASPLSNGNVKSKTTEKADGTAYKSWYESVWQPSGGGA